MKTAVAHLLDATILRARRRLMALLCNRIGHRWTVEPAQIFQGAKYGPYRTCRRCDPDLRLVLLDEPPLEHPDSMTVELPIGQEEWLAELADRTWPPGRGDDERDVAAAWAHLTYGEDT